MDLAGKQKKEEVVKEKEGNKAVHQGNLLDDDDSSMSSATPNAESSSGPSAEASPKHDEMMDYQQEQPMVDISHPHHHDVLCGRGVTTNRHPGNESFRSLVGLNKVCLFSRYF